HATAVPAANVTAHSSDTDRFMSQNPSSEVAIFADQHNYFLARYANLRFRAFDSFEAFLFSDAHRFFDKSFHYLRLRNGLDNFTIDEDFPLAIARSNAQVSSTIYTWTVNNTAHHGNAQREFHAFETRGDFLSQLINVHLCTTTGWARHNFQLAWTQVQRLQNLVSNLDFLNRVSRQ